MISLLLSVKIWRRNQVTLNQCYLARTCPLLTYLTWSDSWVCNICFPQEFRTNFKTLHHHFFPFGSAIPGLLSPRCPSSNSCRSFLPPLSLSWLVGTPIRGQSPWARKQRMTHTCTWWCKCTGDQHKHKHSHNDADDWRLVLSETGEAWWC